MSSHNEPDPRVLLDGLLRDSAVYNSSEAFKQLLEFTQRLRKIAPFNAMLLNLQKPGLTHAASAYDWLTRFKRKPKENARPLIILWPFAPVAFVYDVQDTEGDPIPEDAYSFPVRGEVTRDEINAFLRLIAKKHIHSEGFDAGDGNAGYIRVLSREEKPKAKVTYKVFYNRNHPPTLQLVTIAHELAHLFLGHVGKDSNLSVPDRKDVAHAKREIEAEATAYIFCIRHGVQPKSETYLTHFVKRDVTAKDVDLYHVMRAAGQIESILGLAERTLFGPPKNKNGATPNPAPGQQTLLNLDRCAL